MPTEPTPHDCPTCRMRPGSETAAAKGCLCPVMDNARGHNPPDRLWVRADCPLHGAGSGTP